MNKFLEQHCHHHVDPYQNKIKNQPQRKNPTNKYIQSTNNLIVNMKMHSLFECVYVRLYCMCTCEKLPSGWFAQLQTNKKPTKPMVRPYNPTRMCTNHPSKYASKNILGPKIAICFRWKSA